MERIIVRLLAVSFVLVGVANLVSPGTALALFELELSNSSAFSEARANYGGMHVSLGLLFWFWSRKTESLRYALGLACVFCGGLVLGRVVSLYVDGVPNLLLLSFTVLEVIAAVICAVLLMQHDRDTA